MKSKVKYTLMAAYILMHISCINENIFDPPTPPVSENIVYKSSCTIEEIFWLADNETILLNDFCNGTLKKINTSTKSVQLFDIGARGHLNQRLFYSEQLPQLAFYIALTKDATGVYSVPYKLYSLNLTTGISVLIKDSITENPLVGSYTLGNKKLALKSGTQVLAINLEQSTSKILPISGNVQAFSPDDTKMLIYSSSAPITSVYDFTCQCAQPITLAGKGNPLWRTQGIYGYNYSSNPSELQFINLQSGAVLKSFTGLSSGPWVAQNGSLSTLFAEGPTYNTDNKGSLITYDFVTGQTKEIAKLTYRKYVQSIYGVYKAAILDTPDKISSVRRNKLTTFRRSKLTTL